LLFLGGAAAHGAAASPPSVLTYTDPAGDSGAPDITTVTISGDAASGSIAFAITAAGLQPTAVDGSSRSVDIFLDTDRNIATGAPGGHEYDLYVWSDSPTPDGWYWDLERWSGSDWQEVTPSSTMDVSRVGDRNTLRVGTADLGGATSFGVDVVSFAFDQSGATTATDTTTGFLTWVYDIAGPTKTMTELVSPTIGKPVIVPARLDAGRRVTVSLPVSWKPEGTVRPVAVGKLVGDPSIKGRVIAHTESFRNGVARLSFVVPKTAKGKTIVVKVSVTPARYRGKDGVWIDSSGWQGVMATYVEGVTVTKIVRLPVP
jgi:hypothetical protein